MNIIPLGIFFSKQVLKLLHLEEITVRKVISFNMITANGFFEGPNQDISWHNVDQEFNEFAMKQLRSVDMILFGRVTYQLMANYWPTQAAIENDPIIAKKMNALPKIVFSKTLDKAEWNNTRLIRGNIAKEISYLKGLPGKNLIIFGSSDLTVVMAQMGLVDEFRIMVNPAVIGSGKPFLNGIEGKINMKLLRAKTFHSGNILLYYQPVD
jgi:dihydrofolate reductase